MKRVALIILILIIQLNVFAHNISFIHQDIPFEKIGHKDIKWNELKEPIYNGFDNDVYWFKIELEPSAKDRIISIPESHISRANLFKAGKEIKKLTPKRYVTFKIPNSENKEIYYLKVNCLLEARIPLQINSDEEYYESELKEYIIIGLYIGIVLTVMIFNFFSYFSFGNKTYLFYIFMVLGLAGNAMYKDGLTAYIFGLNSFNEFLEPFVNTIVPITAIYFTDSYLQLEGRLKKLKIAGISVVILTVFTQVLYLIFGGLHLFAGIALLNLTSITIFYLNGPFMWKESYYARFFTIAYGILLFFAFDFYTSPHFGIKFLNLSLDFYKIGSIIEMIVFTYAIMHQAKEMSEENKIMRKKIIGFTTKIELKNKSKNHHKATSDELIEKFDFTKREIELLVLLSQNKTNKEIAEQEFISENTVKFHIKNILKKLEVSSKKDAKYKYLNYYNDDEIIA